VSQALASVEEEAGELEAVQVDQREEAARMRGVLARAGERATTAEKERSRLTGNLESLRARLAHHVFDGDHAVLPDEELARLAHATEALEGASFEHLQRKHSGLQGWVEDQVAQVETLAAESSRRAGSLATAIGRVEARIRSLQAKTSGRTTTRLYDVIRARPGYEMAVEAALGEFGAGVLAENVDEGVRLLSSTERVAVRLDAHRIEEDGLPPGKPLVECVEVVEERYAEALERLLGGIYVTEDPEKNAPGNGYVAVTREGLRLTRTSVSFRPGESGFTREARLSVELERLDALKKRPGDVLYALRAGISEASGRLERLAGAVQRASARADRASRARVLLAREARRRAAAIERDRAGLIEQETLKASLTREARETEAALAEAEEISSRAAEETVAASAAEEAARSAASESDRRLAGLRAALTAGRNRQARLSRELARLGEGPAHETARIAERATRASGRLAAAARSRRNTLRTLRSQTANAHRSASAERTDLARQAADLAGDLAAARANAGRLSEELGRVESSAAAAAEEITTEWGATLEAAMLEAERHPPHTEAERGRLARRLKRFGDVNLLALYQEQGLHERHDLVATQRADAEAAANELNRIILSIDREIEARFSRTFEGVRVAFGEMVPRMMEGAAGVLDLSEEGVEVGLRLGRRGWKPLRVLSGGERALLALSFLFGIFLSQPGGAAGAFCVLDEAEAALDDLNLARFLAVVDSHRADGQYLLVTHQKRTMAAADVLYGVVQDASGATTVVSKRMQGE
jgi:chromosome segregation protein